MPAPLRRRKLMGEINVVPYIDVMLVLLIIFMITAPLLKEGIKVDLPTAGAKPIDPAFLQKHEPLIVTIDARGRLYVNFGPNPDKPASEATVSARTAALLRRDPQTPVLVKADTAVPYGNVAHAMVLLQRAGADKVGLLTDPERPARPRQGRRWGRRQRALNGRFFARHSLAGTVLRAAARGTGGGAGAHDDQLRHAIAHHRAAGCHSMRWWWTRRCCMRHSAAQIERAAEEAQRRRAAADAQAASHAAAEQPSGRRGQGRRRGQGGGRRQGAGADEGRRAQAKAAEQARRRQPRRAADEAQRQAQAKAAAAKQAAARRQACGRRARAQGARGRICAASWPRKSTSMPSKRVRCAIATWRAFAISIQNAWIKPPSARVGIDCLVEVTQVPGGEVTSAQGHPVQRRCSGSPVHRERGVSRIAAARSAGSGAVPKKF